jgi:TonB family protein
LRGLWADDALHFDSDGKLIGTSDLVPFTLSGIEIVKVQLKQNELQLLGRRAGLELTSPTSKRAPLLLGTLRSPREEEVHIEIAASLSGDYSSALDTVFAQNIADLVPAMPSWWQPYAHKYFLADGTHYEIPSPPLTDRPMRVGGSVLPPTMATNKEPDFNLYAKLMQYQGTVLIRLVVDKDGNPSRLVIERGLGLGLDERAIAAVRDYRFNPATQNGKPVVVEIGMEVSFQIY